MPAVLATLAYFATSARTKTPPDQLAGFRIGGEARVWIKRARTIGETSVDLDACGLDDLRPHRDLAPDLGAGFLCRNAGDFRSARKHVFLHFRHRQDLY